MGDSQMRPREYSRAKQLTVHEDVDEEDLHRVQRVGETEEGRDGDDGESGDGSRELEDEEVLDVVEDGLACTGKKVNGESVSGSVRECISGLRLTLLNRRKDGGEVVVDKNHVGCLLCDIGPTLAH